MKKIVIAIGVVIALLAGTLVYNVWRAGIEPVTATPGPLDAGRQHLHDQLAQSKQRENEIEQQDWNSVTLLRELIKGHQQRMDQLSGNGEAGEIVAWDRESITRIEKRISDLVTQQSAQPASQVQVAGNAAPAAERGPASVTPGSIAPPSPPRVAATAPKPPNAAVSKSPATTVKTSATPAAKPATTLKPPATAAPKPPTPTPQPPATTPETPVPAPQTPAEPQTP